MAGERLEKALRRCRERCHEARREERSKLLDEFCRLTRYHRKYAITLLGCPADEPVNKPRRRGLTYSPAAVQVLERIWVEMGGGWG